MALFKSKLGLKDHIDSAHLKLKVSCLECGKVFSPKSLPSHIKSVHQGLTTQSCQICDKTFKRKSGLNAHVAAEHEGIKYSCSQCSFQTPRNDSLRYHIQSIHAQSILKEPCKVCGKILKHRTISKHMKNVHQGKKYSCNICDMQYSSSSGLSDHKKSVHEGIVHKCLEYKSAFSSTCSLTSPRGLRDAI